MKKIVGNNMTYYEDSREDNTVSSVVDASGKSILIVDDNVVNLQVATGILKLTNASVSCCKTGSKCLDVITKRRFDIIFLDHMMPEMDGIQVLHEAREMADSLCKDSVYVALTANSEDGVRSMYIDAGFDDYFRKPIDADKLMELLKKYI